jgi:multidrug resistance efflux pump
VKKQLWASGWLIGVLLLSACAVRQPVQVVSPPQRIQEEPTPIPQTALPTGSVILVDGELTNAVPPLKLAFPGSASGKLLALHVQAGQRIKEGDLIATMDDGELRKAAQEAQTALDRATEDKAKWDADEEKKYQRALRDAEEKYQRELRDAENKYQSELEDARRALDRAERDLKRSRMQPPTTSVAEAQANLAQAMSAEYDAADSYKQALDRPWEDQRIRDSLYKDWQVRIADRELAQLRLQDARIALDVYTLDLQEKEKAVTDAQADLARVEKDEVTKDEVDREVDLTYGRAVEDARRKLQEAQQKLGDAKLYAPWDAMVQSLDAALGTEVGGGTSIVTLLNIRDLYFVTANLSERHVAQLRPGQKAQITLRTYPDVTLTGHVEIVLPQLQRQTDTAARFAAYLRLDAASVDLLPGMTGRVEIMTEEE